MNKRIKLVISIVLNATLLLTSYLPGFTLLFSPQIADAANSCVSYGGGSAAVLNAKVGGVALDQAATFLADMDDIKGAYYDSVKDRIVFIGKENTSLPEFNKDDLAVAIKSVIFKGVLPAVSIEKYEGDPFGPKQRAIYYGGIENTQFGKTLMDADIKLKEFVHGYDKDENPVSTSVSGYESHFQRWLDQTPGLTESNASRWVIRPKLVSLKRDTSTNSFVFNDVQMEVYTEAMSASNSAKWNTAASDFATHHSLHFDDFAQEIPAYADAKQLGKIVAVIKWLSDNGIPSDFAWASDYAPTIVSTPTEVDTVITPEIDGWRLYGGLEYYTPNTYTTDSSTSASFKTASENINAPKEDIHWTFTKDGQTYESVAVAADAFRSIGAYSTSVTDMSFPMTGDSSLSFTRSYSSFSGAQNGCGRGWSFMPAALTDNNPSADGVIIGTCPNDTFNHRYKVAFNSNTGIRETFTNYCVSNTSTYLPDESVFHSSITVTSTSSALTVLKVKQKDQSEYEFHDIYLDPNQYTRTNMRLVAYRDKNGNKTNYNYDSSNKLTSISDDRGHQLAITYNGSNLISSVKDWTNREVSYGYDSQGNLTSVTDPNGETKQYGYNDNYKLSSITDRLGHTILTNTYNDDARLATQVNSGSVSATFTYDDTHRVATTSSTLSRVQTIKYDEKARILEQIDPLNNKTTYTYGTEYAPLTVTDRRNHTTTNTYDSNGNVTSVTDPYSKTVTYTYDGSNRITQISDGRYGASPKVSKFTYDGSGNLTQASESGRITNFTYDSYGEMLTKTDPLTHVMTWTRDSFGNKLTETNDLSKTTTFEYDTLARLKKSTDSEGKFQTFSYDYNNNVLTSTNSAGITTNEYTKENKLKKVTLPDGTITQFTYNNAGSLSSVQDALNNTTTYGYDQYQNITSNLNALNKTTSYTYDKLNRRTGSTTPLSKVTALEYDANGNITKRTDANNKDTLYQYDNLNRLTQISYSDNKIVNYTYDDRGNMTSMSDSLGTTSYSYDIYNRLTQVTDPNSKVVSYSYDNTDNLTQITYPGSKVVAYAYDNANRIETITDWNSQQTTFTYFDNGLIKTKTLPNGIVSSYTYDNANRLSSVQHTKSSTVLAKFDYARNAVGGIITATESGTLLPTTPTSSPSAVTVSNLATMSSVTSASSYTTSSISPSANKLLLLTVASRTGITANPNQPTVTGNGLTWVAVDSRVYDDTSSSRRRITLFRAMGTSPTSGTLSIDFGGQTQTNYSAVVDQVSGMDTSGTNGSGAIVQSANNYDSSSSSSTLSVTLAAFGNTNNATYGTFANGDGVADPTAGSGFTQYGEVTDSNNAIKVLSEFKSTNDTSVDIDWNDPSELGGIAVEIKAGSTSSYETVSASNLISGSTTNVNSSSTASISPSANKLELLTVSSRTDISANPNQPTVTGNGLTWVAVNSIVYDTTSTSRRRVTLFRAMGASPTSGALSIDFSGQTQTDITWSVDELSGVDTTGTSGSGAIVQSATNKDETGSATSLAITLSSFGNTANATYAGIGKDGNTSATAGSGFTISSDVASSTNVGTSTQWKNTNDTSVDISYASSVLVGGIAVEIKAGTSSSVYPNISLSNKTTGSNSSGVNSANTSSISPSANKLQLLTVASRTAITANPNQPTVSGNGLTWTAVNSVVYDDSSSSRRRISVFRALGASPSSGAITISFGGQTQTDIDWSLDEASNVDTSGSNGSGAIVQSATNYDASGTASTLSVSLSSFGSNSNATFGAFANGYGLANPTVGSGFTKYGELADSNNNIKVLTEFKNSNDTSIDINWNDNSELGGIAIELKAAGVQSNTTQFTYDSVHRLLTTTFPANSFVYTYDAVGNRLTNTKDGVQTTATFNDDNKLTQFGSTSYSYDNNGNRTAAGSKTIAYNLENKVATQSASGDPTIEFTYDGNGKRLGQKVNGTQTRRYINDISGSLEKVLITQDLQNSTDNYYLYGNGLVSEGGVSSGNRNYYLEDGLGNIRAITDSSGNSLDTMTYDPYGNLLTGSSSAEFKFKGEQLNTDTSLYYMRARYYDPTTGTFTSKDPHEGDLNNPNSQNGYDYANGDPINLNDPSGELVFADDAIFIGAAACAGVYVYATNPAVKSAVNTTVSTTINQIIGGINTLLDESRNPKQDTKLSEGEIKKLQNGGQDIHDIKGGDSGKDLFKDPKTGEIYIKPKNGAGPGDETGLNINDF